MHVYTYAHACVCVHTHTLSAKTLPDNHSYLLHLLSVRAKNNQIKSFEFLLLMPTLEFLEFQVAFRCVKPKTKPDEVYVEIPHNTLDNSRLTL